MRETHNIDLVNYAPVRRRNILPGRVVWGVLTPASLHFLWDTKLWDCTLVLGDVGRVVCTECRQGTKTFGNAQVKVGRASSAKDKEEGKRARHSEKSSLSIERGSSMRFEGYRRVDDWQSRGLLRAHVTRESERRWWGRRSRASENQYKRPPRKNPSPRVMSSATHQCHRRSSHRAGASLSDLSPLE